VGRTRSGFVKFNGQERYLRWQLQQNPALLGMVAVTAAEPPLPRPNLKDPVPCVARGVASDGSEVTIVCSAGVDIDLLGFVADTQEMADTAVIVALRHRDAMAITLDLLALLATPVEVHLL